MSVNALNSEKTEIKQLMIQQDATFVITIMKTVSFNAKLRLTPIRLMFMIYCTAIYII